VKSKPLEVDYQNDECEGEPSTEEDIGGYEDKEGGLRKVVFEKGKRHDAATRGGNDRGDNGEEESGGYLWEGRVVS